MKKIPFIIIFSVIIFSCKAQTRNSTDNNKTNTMEKFDYKMYNDLIKDSQFLSYGYVILSNGDKLQIFKGSENKGFIQKTGKKNTSYELYKVFYENGNLQFMSTHFYDFSIGISKEYNENGELIKEIDYDKDYKFSIEDLQKKMKATYNVDIMDKKQTRSVSRTTIDPRIKFPYYQVVINSGIASFTNYLLNGNTGEIIYISKTIRDYEKDTVDEYIKSLKK